MASKIVHKSLLHFPFKVKLRLMSQGRSFLANQKARNAIFGAENLLKCNIPPSVLLGMRTVTLNKVWGIARPCVKDGKLNVISARGLKLIDRVWYNAIYYIAYSYNPKGVNYQCKLSLHRRCVCLDCSGIRSYLAEGDYDTVSPKMPSHNFLMFL